MGPRRAVEHDLLFLSGQGRPRHYTTDSREWKALLEGAGVPVVRLHDARHTTATLLLQAGVDVRVVQAIMGHSSVVVTRGYQHADLTMARDAMTRVGRLLGA